jgi:vacuolar-type H+-ATPase subunit I/STV1
MLRSTPMKRFYLALPTKYEDQVIETLGGLGTVQLITDYTVNGFKQIDTVERCEKYVKLQQKIGSILSTLPPEKAAKRGLLQLLKKSAIKPTRVGTRYADTSLQAIEAEVLGTEAQLDSRVGKLEELRIKLKELEALDDNLLILKKHALRADELGDFENIFVKAGFINRAFSLKLDKYVEGTQVRFAKWPDKREDDFVLLVGLTSDKPYVEETLTRLNFAELTLPKGIAAVPAQALDDNLAAMTTLRSEIGSVEKDVRGICEAFQERGMGFEPIVRRALGVESARSAFSRTETLSLVHGWVPSEQEEVVSKQVVSSTNGTAVLRFNDPAPSDNPPVRIEHKGIAGSFDLFTRLRGMPEYSEIDPTLVVTVLFTVMYGMMFGDVGQGILLAAMGLIFSRLQRSFLGIPARAMRKLGGILATCGISAVFFGALYGEFFLTEAFHPIFVTPIQGQTTIIIVALLFGVLQISIGLVLKIVNLLRKKATIEAAFGGVKLAYYVTGVVLAVKYVTGLSFAVFTQNLALTVLAIALLLLVFLSPSVEGVIKHEFNLGEGVMKGVSELIEALLSYLTNSISYVRLAAFAIAHAALGIAAVILAATIGTFPGFILMNFLAITIEALGVFIQCMRLTYYEFFTKFYSGTGIAYHPFSLPKVFGTVK